MTTSVPSDQYGDATTMSVPPFFVSELGADPNQADAIAMDDPYSSLAVNLLRQPDAFDNVFGVSPFTYLEGDDPSVEDYLLLERASGKRPHTFNAPHLQRIQ